MGIPNHFAFVDTALDALGRAGPRGIPLSEIRVKAKYHKITRLHEEGLVIKVANSDNHISVVLARFRDLHRTSFDIAYSELQRILKDSDDDFLVAWLMSAAGTLLTPPSHHAVLTLSPTTPLPSPPLLLAHQPASDALFLKLGLGAFDKRARTAFVKLVRAKANGKSKKVGNSELVCLASRETHGTLGRDVDNTLTHTPTGPRSCALLAKQHSRVRAASRRAPAQ